MSQAMLPPGLRLHPTDKELILYYLKRKVMGKKFQFMPISEVDLYKFAPWDLPEMSCLRTKDLEWFFFCPRDKKYPTGSRANRSTETGYWKTTGKDRSIVHDSRVVGMKKSLIFHTGKPPKGDRTDWVMYEYRLSDDRLAASGVPQDAYVICKIFKKSGIGPKIAEQYGAPFNEEDWEDDVDLKASVAVFPFLPSTVQPSNDNHAIATTSVADRVPVPVIATAMVEPVPESTASISSISESDEEFSDHDGSLHHGEKKKRLSIEQVRTLEKSFEIENNLEPERKIQLAKALGLQPRQVAIWFQNMRAKSKTKQLERDYDVLKRQLEVRMRQLEAVKSEKEALVAFNKKLQSELGETIESFQRSSRVGDSPVYGRENEKNSIIEFLLADDFNRNNLTVVCIVGESGIGKTSIVQVIYSEERVLDSFDARMLITMPEKSDETRLIKKLIECVTSSSCPMTEADLLEELLIDELSGTKFFVVLDDAENENPCFWNRIITILNHSTRGSVLLVTTKSKDVAEVIGASQTYYLNPLSDYYCWKIFCQHIFTGLSTNANTDLVETGKQLVSKCQHNPLCIKVLAGLLVCLKNEKSWVEILKTDLWNMDGFDGDTLPTLRVGYELLPNDLKKCLHYCSLFPKDYAFAKQQIVRMWMSQGFIISMEGRQPEEVGLQYFDELLLRGFFQHSPLHDVEEDKFIMHDLIRALATNLSRKKGFPAEDALERIFENCFHFSLNPSKIQMDEMEPLINSDLQSFLALTRFSLQTRINISTLDITSLSDLFTKCINIRTLDLSCTDTVELPSSVGMLKQLRYLCVNNTKIRSIPRELCSLVSLQTLEAKDCQHLVELPESMMELTNLRHLDVSKKSGRVKMMIGIGQLTNLRSLAVFCVGCEMPYCSIRELKDLNCLSSCLQIAGLENIRNGLDAKEAALHNKVHLNTLWMHWDDNRTCIESEESVTISEEVLKNLKPNPQIGELIIRNYRGNLFPTWMGDPSFSKLVSIILDNCIKCSQFPALGGLPSLRNLSAQKLYHLVNLENTDSNFGLQNTPKFPSLETLNLWEMYDLEELFETSDRDFPCLRTLSVSRCPMLKRIPYFSSLLNLSLYCCVKLPYLPDFPSLKSLRIDGFQKIKSLELPKDLPALKELEIKHCNELLLVEGLTKLPSLEKLNVVHCPKLDSLRNWKPCHSKPISTTKWFFQKEESTTQMEHQETTEPAEKHTEVVVMASLDDSKKRAKALETAEPAEKRTKALETAEPAEKHTKALKTAEPAEKHTKVVVQLGSLDDSKKRTKALKTVVSIEGITSVVLDGNRLVVVCDGPDLIAMITLLRKKLGYAELVSVTSVDERIREEQENKISSVSMSSAGAPSYQYGNPLYLYPNPDSSCGSEFRSIM